jgi:hypothetical protein
MCVCACVCHVRLIIQMRIYAISFKSRIVYYNNSHFNEIREHIMMDYYTHQVADVPSRTGLKTNGNRSKEYHCIGLVR